MKAKLPVSVLLLMGTPLLAQTPPDMPLAAPNPEVYATLPLEPAQRSELEAAMKAREYKRAETILVDAIERHPKSVAMLKLAAGIFFLDGQYLNAAIALKKADKIEVLDPGSRFKLAMAYVALGKREWARPELSRLEQESPKEPLYVYWLARLDYDDQKFAAAVGKLKQAIALRPDYMKAHDNLGLNLEALGRFDEAERAYEEAARLNRLQKPSSPWPPLNLGVMLIKLEKLEHAETCLREALQYNPGFAEARYRLGTLLEKQGNTQEAVKELKQAAALDQAYPEPLYALARIYRQQGDAQAAQSALEEFQKRKADRRSRGKR